MGIPFAQPPVGKLRWQPPVRCVNGHLRKALEFPSQCPQPGMDGEATGNEDCLYLNIYTPKIESYADLPVMVYIHGGSLLYLNASTQYYTSDESLAAETGMVHVSIQYRLGTLGYLVLNELENRTGNYGLLDQIEALRWVQRNIKNFGGDPKQVTVWGQSSGGTSVLALSISPLARSLFQRAWMVSGSPVLGTTYQKAVVQHEAFFLNNTRCRSHPGCDTKQCIEKCLYGLDAETIVKAMPKSVLEGPWSDLPKKDQFFVPLLVIDGTVVPDSPQEVWKQKLQVHSDVPMMIGTTAQETDCGIGIQHNISKWTNESYQTYVAQHLDTFGGNITDEALKLYPWNHNAELQYSSMGADIRQGCVTCDLARMADEHLTAGVYRYVVTYRPSNPVRVFLSDFNAKYAYHGIDLFAFTGSLGNYMQGSLRSSDKAYIKNIRDNMLNFARTGQPKDSSWRSATNSTNATALLSDKITFVLNYEKEKCHFWKDNGFADYTWIT